MPRTVPSPAGARNEGALAERWVLHISDARNLLSCHIRPVFRMIDVDPRERHYRSDAEYPFHVIQQLLSDRRLRIGARIAYPVGAADDDRVLTRE